MKKCIPLEIIAIIIIIVALSLLYQFYLSIKKYSIQPFEQTIKPYFSLEFYT